MTDRIDQETGSSQPQASELEGGGTDQNWGQGEGRHQPTIPSKEDQPGSTVGGDPDLPLARDDEGTDR